MNTRLFLYSDEGSWIGAQVGSLIKAIEDAVRRGCQSFHVCLSGGLTPEPVNKALASDARLRRLAGSCALHFWVGDERDVPQGHEHRNETMIRRSLAGILDVAHFHPWPYGEREQVCRAYAEAVRSHLGSDPVFDFTFLGMGTDGHTAGIFTSSDAQRSKKLLAYPSESSRSSTARVTLSAEVLKRSAILLVSLRGSDKREALEDALKGKPSPIFLIAGQKGSFYYLNTEENS